MRSHAGSRSRAARRSARAVRPAFGCAASAPARRSRSASCGSAPGARRGPPPATDATGPGPCRTCAAASRTPRRPAPPRAARPRPRRRRCSGSRRRPPKGGPWCSPVSTGRWSWRVGQGAWSATGRRMRPCLGLARGGLGLGLAFFVLRGYGYSRHKGFAHLYIRDCRQTGRIFFRRRWGKKLQRRSVLGDTYVIQR
jgi:hypothetical protein